MLNKNISVGGLKSESYALWALSSTVPDYRLAWLINNHLQISLQRDNLVQGKEGLTFAMFTADDTPSVLKYTLISNKNTQEGSILFADYHTVDFFLKISGTTTQEELDKIRKKLKTIPEVSACIPISSEKKVIYLFFANIL